MSVHWHFHYSLLTDYQLVNNIIIRRVKNNFQICCIRYFKNPDELQPLSSLIDAYVIN